MNVDTDRVQDILGRKFSNKNLLFEALTHSSAAEKISYQRLEFLGDRVLGLVIAEFLITAFPTENEGSLARRLSGLVDKSMLAKVAVEVGIGPFIIMSESEKASGGDANENILSDIMEALIGATFLDSDIDECREMVKKLWGNFLYETLEPPVDPKTALQEWTQGRGLGLPVYELVGRDGPDHAPVFDVKVSVEGHGSVVAKGTSRRAAEKLAASRLLDKLSGVNVSSD
jgi:ribonuclease-3